MPTRGKKVHCPGPRGRFCRARKVSPAKFDPRSFRIIRRGKIQIVIGCPRGKWKSGRCSVGTRAQSIRYPIGHKKCSVCRR